MKYFNPTAKPPLQVFLLADDDLDDVGLFTEALGSNRNVMDLKVANDGLEAIDLVQQLPQVDIVFLDINMPRMNGLECLARIRVLSQTLPVIILTTSTDETLIKQAKALGASGFISKPLVFSRYQAVMKDVLSIDWTKHYPLFYLSTH